MESIWNELARAIALVLIIEGMLPFIFPRGWKRMVEMVSASSDNSLRITGLALMLLGLLLLYIL